MTSNRKWFFDLEQTIIDSWESQLLINIQSIKDLVDREKIEEIEIFSFAIWNEDDQARFYREVKPMIERALGVKVTAQVSVDELIEETKRNTGTVWTRWDFCSVLGKPRAFEDHVRFSGFKGHALLVDDIVSDQANVDRKNGTITELINVRSVSDWAPLVIEAPVKAHRVPRLACP